MINEKKLKIAFCFSTEIRDGHLLHESIKSFMQNGNGFELDIDYYLHTWDHTYLKDHNKWNDSIANGSLKEGEFKRRRTDLKTPIDFSKLNKFLNVYNIKKHRIDNENTHLEPLKEASYCHFNLDYLWESLWLCFELLEEEYDIVVYCRPDICFHPNIKFVDYIEEHLKTINDTIFHHEMFLFLSTYANIKTMLTKIKTEFTADIIHSEKMIDWRGPKVFEKLGFKQKEFAPSMFPGIVRPENLHLNPITEFDEFYRINKILYS